MSASPRGTLHFILAAVILAGSSGALLIAKQRGWLVVIKKALPVRKPLNEMDQKALSPWRVVSAGRLSAENEQEVGTREYLTWTLADPTGTSQRSRGVQFTAFYYTGVQDQVPHVAEECLFQADMTQAEGKVRMDWQMPALKETVEVARVVFDDPKHIGVRLFNYYTICVNGEFHGDRDPVRLRMADPRDTHLYYCKVDVSIQGTTETNVQEVDAVAKEVLDRGIAELVRSHWPLRGWERGGPREPGAKEPA